VDEIVSALLRVPRSCAALDYYLVLMRVGVGRGCRGSMRDPSPTVNLR
jgi:hypothetical protein